MMGTSGSKTLDCILRPIVLVTLILPTDAANAWRRWRTRGRKKSTGTAQPRPRGASAPPWTF